MNCHDIKQGYFYQSSVIMIRTLALFTNVCVTLLKTSSIQLEFTLQITKNYLIKKRIYLRLFTFELLECGIQLVVGVRVEEGLDHLDQAEYSQ